MSKKKKLKQKMGGRFKKEYTYAYHMYTYVYLWLIHVELWGRRIVLCTLTI